MAPSLDRLAWKAPRFSLAAIRDTAATRDEWYNRLALVPPQTSIAAVFQDRFGGQPVAAAAASGTELATLFKRGRARTALAAPQPGDADIGAEQPAEAPTASVQLAYADPSPTAANDGLSAISTVAPAEDGIDATADVYGDLPSAVPLPVIRPDDGLVEPERSDRSRQKKLALAKPDSPVEREPDGQGWSLRDLFGGAKAGNGVAVYDISAAKVYMPDGSVLEAHSGIGQMADNPRYVHVKMNGPTPPHTYNLKMRESRFHGVEAIRMLPVDGRNKHGRTGFLTHSYLLRGRTGQSHGCVAFKDYQKFLAAFKKGKVRQLVVVSGGGKAVARATQKGRDT